MGKNARNRDKARGCGFNSDNFWQSQNFNQRVFMKNLHMLAALAVNRFRWVGLPDTCDARFLEWILHTHGIASISFDKDTPDIWETKIASAYGPYNTYGVPTKWRASGWGDASIGYECTHDNGELVYHAFSRFANSAAPVVPWNDLEIFARRMTHYERTEDINLAQQQKPWIFVAEREQRQVLINLLKQTAGGEPIVLGNRTIGELAENVTTLNVQTPLIVEELAQAKQNVLHEALLYLGIPHLAFEKGERMIEDEARANTAPTNIMLLDCLQARRQAADVLNREFGLSIEVYFNDDWKSYNYNYTHNIEAMAQDRPNDNNDIRLDAIFSGDEDE